MGDYACSGCGWVNYLATDWFEGPDSIPLGNHARLTNLMPTGIGVPELLDVDPRKEDVVAEGVAREALGTDHKYIEFIY